MTYALTLAGGKGVLVVTREQLLAYYVEHRALIEREARTVLPR